MPFTEVTRMVLESRTSKHYLGQEAAVGAINGVIVDEFIWSLHP